MSNKKILVLAGDGIGPEITAATVRVVEAMNHRFNLGLELEHADSGLTSLEKHGTTLTEAVQAQARAADGVILGPCDTIVYPDVNNGGVNPSAWFRKNFDLYANMRPSRARDGAPAKAPEIDLVIARENTEGFYADRSMFAGSGEFMPTKDVALAVRKITREGSRRITDAACKLAMTPSCSAWSATTKKSRGRRIRAGSPFKASTTSPLAKRYAKLGEDWFPRELASGELLV